MFKKLKQRIEEEEQLPVKVLQSTPKKNVLQSAPKKSVNGSKARHSITKTSLSYSTPKTSASLDGNVNKNTCGVIKAPSSVINRSTHSISTLRSSKPASGVSILPNNGNSLGGFIGTTAQQNKKENKWEKRRLSGFSSSIESLISADSGAISGTAEFPRTSSYGRGSSSIGDNTLGHFESPIELEETVCDSTSREEILTELAEKKEKVRALQNKINELSSAYIEQGKQRDCLEKALEDVRNEMLNRSQSTMNNENFQTMREEYEKKLSLKDQQIKEYRNKHQESLHSAAELVAKSMKVEHIEKEYEEQKHEFEHLQRTLNDLSNDRSRYEMQIQHLSMQLGIAEKDKSTLKGELADSIDDLTQKSRMVKTLQCSLDKAHEEACSIQQSYNCFKAKAISDIDERDAEITMWKNKNHELQQKLNGIQLSEDEQIKARNSSSNVESENHLIDTLRNKVRELEQKCLAMKAEKMELEILANKSTFLESQNNLLDARFKETVERLEADRSQLEEQVCSLQMDSHKTSYRQDQTSRQKVGQLETKLEDQNRIILEYQERLEKVVAEKDAVIAQIKHKEDESKKASGCLEEAMVSTTELKKEIVSLEEALREKDDLIRYIKETRDKRFSSREKDLLQRDEEIEELQHILQDRDDELAAVSEQFHKLQDSHSRQLSNSNEIELQKTIARLTDKLQEVENKRADRNSDIEKRTLKSELDEANKKIRTLQQNLEDLKKHCQKEKASQVAAQNEDDMKLKKSKKSQEFLDVNFKYLKHVILKYMCGANDQSRQLVGVIGHLLQFTPRESSIVRDCFEWKLPIKK